MNDVTKRNALAGMRPFLAVVLASCVIWGLSSTSQAQPIPLPPENGAMPGFYTFSPINSANHMVARVFREQMFLNIGDRAHFPKELGPREISEWNRLARFFRPDRIDLRDISYARWKMDDVNGRSYGVAPSFTFGGDMALQLSVPIRRIKEDKAEAIDSAGVEACFRSPYWRWAPTDFWKWAVGVHGYIYTEDWEHDNYTFKGFGPYITWYGEVSDIWSVALGAMFEYTEPEEGDKVTQVIVGANATCLLNDFVAVAPYALYHRTDKHDLPEEDYMDLGFDITIGQDHFQAKIGYRGILLSSDYYEQNEFSGSLTWRF
jgi:hypothetical protein